MKYKYIKINLDKFKIKFNGTDFRDIHEFVFDMKNIFIQMKELSKEFGTRKKASKGQKESKKEIELLENKLSELIRTLEQRLDYIIDPNKVSELIVGNVRPKLIQLKSLSSSVGITESSKDNINRLLEYYHKRILEEKKTVSGKVHYVRK